MLASKFLSNMAAVFSMLGSTYYVRNYASIMWTALVMGPAPMDQGLLHAN